MPSSFARDLINLAGEAEMSVVGEWHGDLLACTNSPPARAVLRVEGHVARECASPRQQQTEKSADRSSNEYES